MAFRLSSVIAVLFGTVFLSTGQGLHQALIPISAEALRFSAVTLSILASVYFGGFLAGCLVAPSLIRRVGHTRTLAISASLLSALSLAHVILPDQVVWIALRLFVGVSFAVIDVVLESWLASRAEDKDRGQVLSVYRLIHLFAVGIGQFLIAAAPPTEFLLFAVVAILVSVAVIIVSASVAPAPEAPGNIKVRFWRVFNVSPLAIISAVLHGAASGIYWGFAPVFAIVVMEDRASAGIMLSATLAGAAAAQYPIGWASDKFDRRKVIVFISATAAVSAVSIGLAASIYIDAIIAIIFVFGAATFCIYPVAITYAFDRARPSEFVEVGASVLVAYGFGASLGPLLTPVVLQFGNNSGAFYLMGVFYSAIFVFALYRSSKTGPVREDETVEFVAMPSTTPVTMAIDPRTDEAAPRAQQPDLTGA